MPKDVLSQVIDIILSFFDKKPAPIAAPASVNKMEPPVAEVGLDWSKPESKISEHFTVKDAIYLPTWKRLANQEDGLDSTIKVDLQRLFAQMDVVRSHFGKPIRVHVTYRPSEYNKAIGGAQHSAHSEGLACDWDIPGINCDEVRKEIVDKGLLDTWNMRMEDLPGSSWVHLDLREVPIGGHRYFLP